MFYELSICVWCVASGQHVPLAQKYLCSDNEVPCEAKKNDSRNSSGAYLQWVECCKSTTVLTKSTIRS